MYRHIGAVHVFVGRERLIEVGEVGIDRVGGGDVELGVKRVAIEADYATLLNRELAHDDILEREVVASFLQGVITYHGELVL